MTETITHLYAPNLMSVCIEQEREGDYGGLVWDQYHQSPAPFANMMELIRHVEAFLDELDFPQRSTIPRSFERREEPGAEKSPAHQRRKRDKVMDMEHLEEKRGDQGTFIVQIKYRQNATWQGQVVWAEQNKKMYFRSALELLHLIDSAMSETEQSEEEPKESGRQ